MKIAPYGLPLRTGILAGVLLALVLAWALFHKQVYHQLAFRLLLKSDNPREEFFTDLARQANDPVAFLQRCWATGKVTHRHFVATFLKDSATRNSPWLARAEPLVLACATDADFSVRELGLATAEACHSPGLFEAARAQLTDLDPLVRLLGLEYLRKADPKRAVPVLIRLLDDPDPRVVATAELNLMRCSGEDFGVRAKLAITPVDSQHPGELEPANAERIRAGIVKRKEWWKMHQNDYPADSGLLMQTAETGSLAAARPPAPDFTLRDLQGKTVRLSDLRGKVVLLNFWATWCTACLAEIPDLVALEKKLNHQAAIVGVALDGVPDEDGDTPGEEAAEHSDKPKASAKTVRLKVERAVKARQINYPVALDSKNSVGGQYNGGELPTTVIIDAEGRVRRRFIGERNQVVFEAMIAEASHPLGSHLNN